MKGMDRLLELQTVDSAVDRLEARKRELASGDEVQVARARMEEAEGRLGEVRLALDAVSLEQQRLEHEIDTLSQKVDAEERRLYDGSVVNVKELEAIQAEIANLRARRGRIEDELLEQLVRRDDLEAKATTAEAEAAETRVHLEAIGGDAVRELAETEEALSSRATGRAAIVSEIDEELIELYEGLRAQKKGIGAAALVDGVCQGCHEKLSALELDRLKKTEGVKRCEYCRRIVIFA
jgi:predicted  nucleic acid-binding Zn-ribbon protein